MPPIGDKAPKRTRLWGTVRIQTTAGTKAKYFGILIYHPWGKDSHLPSALKWSFWNEVSTLHWDTKMPAYIISVFHIAAAGKESHTNSRDSWRLFHTCVVVVHAPHLVVYHQAKIALSVGLTSRMWSNPTVFWVWIISYRLGCPTTWLQSWRCCLGSFWNHQELEACWKKRDSSGLGVYLIGLRFSASWAQNVTTSLYVLVPSLLQHDGPYPFSYPLP